MNVQVCDGKERRDLFFFLLRTGKEKERREKKQDDTYVILHACKHAVYLVR